MSERLTSSNAHYIEQHLAQGRRNGEHVVNATQDPERERPAEQQENLQRLLINQWDARRLKTWGSLLAETQIRYADEKALFIKNTYVPEIQEIEMRKENSFIITDNDQRRLEIEEMAVRVKEIVSSITFLTQEEIDMVTERELDFGNLYLGSLQQRVPLLNETRDIAIHDDYKSLQLLPQEERKTRNIALHRRRFELDELLYGAPNNTTIRSPLIFGRGRRI